MSVGSLHFCQSTFKHAECIKNSSLHLWTSSKSNAFLSGNCLKACCSLPERTNGKFVLQMRRYPFRKFLKWNGVKRIQPVYMYGMSHDTRTWQAYASVWVISIVITGASPVYWKTKPSFVCRGIFPQNSNPQQFPFFSDCDEFICVVRWRQELDPVPGNMTCSYDAIEAKISFPRTAVHFLRPLDWRTPWNYPTQACSI